MSTVITSYTTYTEPANFQGPSRLDRNCTICQDTLSEGVVIGHPKGLDKNVDDLVHKVCMEKWLLIGGDSCAMCKAPVNLGDFLTQAEIVARQQNIDDAEINSRINMLLAANAENPPTEDELCAIRALLREELRARREYENTVINNQQRLQPQHNPQHQYKTAREILKDNVVESAVFLGGLSAAFITISTVAIAALDGLAQAWQWFTLITPVAGMSCALTVSVCTLGSIAGIAAGRFAGFEGERLEKSSTLGSIVALCVVKYCDFQIKSIALTLLGIVGAGVGIIGVGLAAGGIRHLYNRNASQVPA